jgi:hypothetical protein
MGVELELEVGNGGWRSALSCALEKMKVRVRGRGSMRERGGGGRGSSREEGGWRGRRPWYFWLARATDTEPDSEIARTGRWLFSWIAISPPFLYYFYRSNLFYLIFWSCSNKFTLDIYLKTTRFYYLCHLNRLYAYELFPFN